MEYQLADLFEALCDANPDAPCVIAGAARRSRAELDRRANQLAHHLEQQGITPGDHVRIYAYNRVEWLESTGTRYPDRRHALLRRWREQQRRRDPA